ncbi:MAG: PEP/pyruvate-binding domain-containing protein, partial [Syntrophomonas sp.]|nr:PEP/pyruvate-binding domain-containing protein [Syntrophomonas sp.]
GYFLEKERKLLRTIAERIGQTIQHRYMEQVIQEWNTSKSGLYLNGEPPNEWMIILDLIGRTDQSMLLHLCRKMINYLYLSGVREAEEVLWTFGEGTRLYNSTVEQNYPTEKFPLGNLISITNHTFKIAARHLSDAEISTRVRKWLQEEKAYPLIKEVDRINASVAEICRLIIRYRNSGEGSALRYSPMEHWLVVALISRFLSDRLEFINIARPFFEINDFYDIVSHLIFPEGSHGKIGGKGTGIFLARQIMEKAGAEIPALGAIKVPKTWYMATDALKEFLHHNRLEELRVQKYKELYEVRLDYPNIVHIMKNSEFPTGIIKSLAMALDDFGEVPLIVRSSSLLEDQLGAAFSGKYKSLFLANQGSKQERLESLIDAIIEVYASVYSPNSIQYRAERGLLDYPEEMGILIQEVVGTRVGPYFFPVYAGVAFSNNEFRWSSRIKREDGLVRMVLGLGTRAVDRVTDDFPVLAAPGQPRLRVNTVPDEIRRYSPKKADVINLEKNIVETVEISTLLKEWGHLIPQVHKITSVYEQDYVRKAAAFSVDFPRDELLVTFDGLVADTPFMKRVHLMLNTLQNKLGFPVDIEFASDGKDFYLLQCRPQSSGQETAPAAIPKDIPNRDILFSANRYVSNGLIRDISHVVYIDPDGYNRLQRLEELVDVGRAVSKLNLLLPRHHFLLMGPGRWGSRGDIRLGVQVSYADINNTAALIEIARQKLKYMPELSFGTHFFQDLVESNIRYLPLYPDDEEVLFRESFFLRSENMLRWLLPEYAHLDEVIRVIDVPAEYEGRVVNIAMNSDLEEAIAYLGSPFIGASSIKPESRTALDKQEAMVYKDEKYWRWRQHMAERIAASLDMERFGVQAIYLFGSTNSGDAGPGSDIDLIIHFRGTESQQQQLLLWMEGWSISLAEMNYLRTGYASGGLLDIHIVTDEDITKKSSYAIKIDAITDPAYLLRARTDS